MTGSALLRRLGLVGVLAVFLAAPAAAPAAVIEVTRGIDAFGAPDAADPTRCANPELGSHQCRLRDALALAQDVDPVGCSSLFETRAFSTQPLQIAKQVTVDLNGQEL